MKHKWVWAHAGFSVKDDVIWFVPYEIGVLLGFSLSKKEIIYSQILPVTTAVKDTYINTILINDYIILVPSYEAKIYVLNMRNKKISTYDLPDILFSAKFFNYAILDEIIYLFPYECSFIIQVQLNDRGEVDFREIPSPYRHFIGNAQVGTDVYLINDSNELLKYSLPDNLFETFSFEDNGNLGFSSITKHDNMLFISRIDGNIYYFDIKTQSHGIWQIGEEYFHSIVAYDDKLYAFPEHDFTKGVIFNNCGEKEEIKFSGANINRDWQQHAFSLSLCYNGKIYVFNLGYQSLYEIDTVSNEIAQYYIALPKFNDAEKESLLYYSFNTGIVQEGLLGLKELNESIFFEDKLKKESLIKRNVNIGNRIYCDIMGRRRIGVEDL